MESINKSYITIVKLNQDNISWKLKKSYQEFEIGLWVTIISFVTFFTGVFIFNFILNNNISFDLNLTIPIILNLIIVVLDITVVSITFNWDIGFNHLRIPDNELIRKRKQILVFFALLILFFGIFIYWLPKITTSIMSYIIYVIVVVLVLVLLSIFHLLTIFFAGLAVTIFKGRDTITINFKEKFIKKEKRNTWNNSVDIMYFEELKALSVRNIKVRKLPYWELVLICNEKAFQIITGTEEFLKEYATQLNKILNLPIE